MKNKCPLLLVCLYCSMIYSQDTIVRDYPGINQRWETISNKGKKVKETIFYQSNTPWMSASYDPNNQEHWNWYHENGNLFFKATIINDKIEGLYQIWYPNGQLAEELEFKDNIENGHAKYYYTNGQLAMSGQYNEGKMVGNWLFLAENGCPANGKWEWSFAALPGKIRMQGNLENGKRCGEWTYRTTASGTDEKKFLEIFLYN